MLNDNSWRKLPRDLLTDEDFRWVENQLPNYLKFAPYMFYIAALRKADYDGMFDIEDGTLFAQLMRIENPAVVFFIVNKLRKRGIIYRVGETTVCGFCNWEYPQKEKPRSMEQRRQAVMARIEEKKKEQAATSDFPTGSTRPDETTECGQEEDFGNQTEPTDLKSFEAGAAFFCPENDKNAENVVTEVFDDKIQKNVVIEGETERKKAILDKNRQERHTHQIRQKDQLEKERQEPEESSGLLDGPTLPSVERPGAVAQKDYPEVQEETVKQDDVIPDSGETVSLAEQALQVASEGVVENDSPPDVESYLNDFFAKNCYGYQKDKAGGALKTLAKEITALSDEKNPPSIGAAVLCGEFKRMHEGKVNEHWRDIPLLPSMMINNGVWAHLLVYAGKILMAKADEDNAFLKAAEKAKQEAEADAENVSVESEKELLKYGIKADDPQRIPKLLAIKAAEQRKLSEADEEDDEETIPAYDIF